MSKELKVPTVSKQSLAGQLIEADYDGFKAIVETADNIADTFAKVDNTLAQNIELGKDAKRAIDAELKKLKLGEQKLREYMAHLMEEKGLKKLEGGIIKSITFQEQKVIKKTISDKQIKKGRSYVSISELSKDDLVEMLEEKGVKTRVVVTEVEEKKPSSIRVVR